MTTTRRLFFYSLALVCLCAVHASAGSFTTVINSPPDSLDPLWISLDEGALGVGAGQQLNLAAFTDNSVRQIVVRDGGELNYSAGVEFGTLPDIDVRSGGAMNVLAGVASTISVAGSGSYLSHADGFTDWLVSDFGAEVLVEGGTFNEIQNAGGSLLFTGGSAGYVLVDSASSGLPAIVVTGGNLLGESGALDVFGGVAELRGGDLGLETAITNVSGPDGRLEFFGSGFAIDGRSIDGLEAGRSFEVADRDVTLSGFLEDGSPFTGGLSDFDSSVTFGVARIGSTGSVGVTLVIPEPSSATSLCFAVVALAGAARRRSGRAFGSNRHPG